MSGIGAVGFLSFGSWRGAQGGSSVAGFPVVAVGAGVKKPSRSTSQGRTAPAQQVCLDGRPPGFSLRKTTADRGQPSACLSWLAFWSRARDLSSGRGADYVHIWIFEKLSAVGFIIKNVSSRLLCA